MIKCTRYSRIMAKTFARMPAAFEKPHATELFDKHQNIDYICDALSSTNSVVTYFIALHIVFLSINQYVMHAKTFMIGAIFIFLLSISEPSQGQSGFSSGLFSNLPVNAALPRLGLQVGTQFSSGMYGGSMLTNSIAPTLNWILASGSVCRLVPFWHHHISTAATRFFPIQPIWQAEKAYTAWAVNHCLAPPYMPQEPTR